MLFSNAEKVEKSVDQGRTFGALLTNLSKAIDCLDYEPFIKNLNVFVFNLPNLKLIHNYLSNRKQRTSVNLSYNGWLSINSFLSFTKLNTWAIII